MVISSALLALAPKCPICFLAYFGVFGITTATASAYRAWLPPITAIWLTLTLATLAFPSKWRRSGPLLLGFGAALIVMSGKFIWENQTLVGIGIVALLAAIGWRTWLMRASATDDCAQCKASATLQGKRAV
jgi:hypothetical protein